MQTVKLNVIAGAATALILSLAAVQSMAQVPPGPSAQPQAGVVVPGAPAQAAPQPASAPAPQAALPGQPGTPIAGAVAPQLPPLPNQQAQAIRPGSVAVDDVLPPSLAGDVAEIKRRLDEFQRAQAAATAPLGKPVTRTVTITQQAGEAPQVLRLSPGIPTDVIFLDSTGQPWPIEFATPGADSSKFDVVMPMPGTPTLQIRPKQNYHYAGLSVTLKGNPIPVSFLLTASQKEVDTRLDVNVARRGPNAAAPIIDRIGAPHATDVSLMSFLDGVPPQGSREVKTSLNSVRAWLWNDRLIVRSELPVVSPAWSDNAASPSGVTNAYVLPVVPSILVTNGGRMVSVKVDN